MVLLHVFEKIPDYVEGRLEGMLGEDQWRSMMSDYESDVRSKLIGKRSSSRLVRAALAHFCNEAGIDEASCGYQSREVVVSDGDVADTIIKTSTTHACDIVILGAREGAFSKRVIGGTTKTVLRKSKLPVLVVPAIHGEPTTIPDISTWRE